MLLMLLDASAWVEFFQGTEKSKKVESVLKTEENFTSIVSIAEIVNWCLRNDIRDMITIYAEGIKKGSRILDLSESIALAAGELNFDRKKTFKNWGMLDSFIVATSLLYDLRILTKDSQFKDLPNVEMLY
jgi:predicted nucleic acid-binding protein